MSKTTEVFTLFSGLGKLFTRILNNRLTQWAEDYYIYVLRHKRDFVVI